MNTTSTATIKTTVIDALEQATEDEHGGDIEGLIGPEDALYLTLFDLGSEVRMCVPSAAELTDADLWAEIGRVLAALEELDAAVVYESEGGVFGWRLDGPAGDVAHALLEDFEG